MNNLLQKNYAPFFFEKESKFSKQNLLVFLVFSLLFVGFKLTYHELWKDEWQAWHVARDMSWSEMFSFLYYEGHPSLWYIYLKIITLCTPSGNDLVALQLAHALITLSAFRVLFFRFHFSIWVKMAILLGFFCWFEYGTVNRGYSLVMLLAFWATTLIDEPEKNIWKIALALFLLCQTEAQGVIIAGGIWFYAFAKMAFDSKFKMAIKNKELQLLLGVFAFGLFLFVLTVYPRGEAEDLARAYNMAKQPFLESISLAFQGLLANTFWIGSIQDTGAFGISISGISLSVIILFSIFYLFLDQKNILITMFVGIVSFYLFAAFVFSGGVRQWGILFIFFILVFNLFGKRVTNYNLFQSLIILSFLGFQLYYNALAITKEISFPFSNAEKTAGFLAQNVPVKVPIVAINPFETGAVVGYLGEGRKVFKMPEGKSFTWFRWLSKVYIPTENELKLFAQFKGVGGIIILTNTPLISQRFPNAALWKAFDTYSIKNEKFYVYTLAK